jgi:hypothetical protein
LSLDVSDGDLLIDLAWNIDCCEIVRAFLDNVRMVHQNEAAGAAIAAAVASFLWPIRNVWSAAALQAKNENDIVGLRECIRPLCELLLWPLMECAALLSFLVRQAFKPIPDHRFQECRVRPLYHLMVHQQTWQESTIHISRRWSVIVGIANAISKPGVFRQASIAGQLFQTAAVSILRGGR